MAEEIFKPSEEEYQEPADTSTQAAYGGGRKRRGPTDSSLRRNLIIVVGVIVLAFAIYKLFGVFFGKRVQPTTSLPTSTLTAPTTTRRTALPSVTTSTLTKTTPSASSPSSNILPNPMSTAVSTPTTRTTTTTTIPTPIPSTSPSSLLGGRSIVGGGTTTLIPSNIASTPSPSVPAAPLVAMQESMNDIKAQLDKHDMAISSINRTLIQIDGQLKIMSVSPVPRRLSSIPASPVPPLRGFKSGSKKVKLLPLPPMLSPELPLVEIVPSPVMVIKPIRVIPWQLKDCGVARNAYYYLQAVIPGRAWLKTQNGTTLTVKKGDCLRGYGKVRVINARQGFVVTSRGKVIRFHPKESAY